MILFCLGLILGTYQIGYISFVQLNLDSAAQITARMASLGYDKGVTSTWAAQALAGLNGATISPGELQNPQAVNDDGLNRATAGGAIGGFSFTIPFPSVSIVNSNTAPVYIGSIKVPLSGFGIDSAIRELCPHVCSNGNQTQLNNSVLPFSPQAENTTPYFMSFNYMRACYSDFQKFNLLQPPLPLGNGTSVWDWQTCQNLDANSLQNSTQDLRALGTAAHLDATNSAYLRHGEESVTPPLLTAPPNPADVGPFFETWCHRDIFVWLELNVFSHYPNYSDVVNGGGAVPFLQQWMTPLGTPPATLYPQPGAIMYENAAGFLNHGWDVQPIIGNTQYNVAKYPSLGTPWPWYGCGIYH